MASPTGPGKDLAPAAGPRPRSSGFPVFLASQVISWLGDHVDRLAIPWLVQELTGSPAALGALALSSQIPDLAATPLAGVLVDRIDRRRLMIAVDLFSGLVVSALAFLAWRGLVQPWHLYTGMALFSAVRAAYAPAQMALLPTLVPPGGLTRANGLVSGFAQGMGIVGPAAGAGIIAAAGLAGAIQADGLSFFLAAGLLSLVRPLAARPAAPALASREPHGSRDAGRPLLADVAAGARYIARHPVIGTLLASFAVINLGTGPVFVLLPTFVRQLGGGPEGMALLGSAAAAGGLAGALLATFVPEVRRKGLLITLSLLASTAPFTALALAPSLTWAAVWMAVWGLMSPWIQVNVNVTFQRLVPSEIQGRVFSVRFFIARSLAPVSLGAAGLLAAAFGPTPVFLAGAALGAAAALGALLVRPVRDLVI